MGCGPRTNQLDFGGDPDQDPHPRFLNPDPNPDIFYCPAQLIRLSRTFLVAIVTVIVIQRLKAKSGV